MNLGAGLLRAAGAGWVPAWGAIASQAKGIGDRKVKLANTGGCLLAALVVLLVICALLAILFMQ